MVIILIKLAKIFLGDPAMSAPIERVLANSYREIFYNQKDHIMSFCL